MIEMKVEFSLDEYVAWKSCTTDKDDFITTIAKRTAFPPNAYGCYPKGIVEEDGKFYAIWKRYKCCD